MKQKLNKDLILNTKDIKIVPLIILEWATPDWDGEVYIKTLTGAERDQLESAIIQWSPDGKTQKTKMDKLRSMLAYLAVCDEDGNRLFVDDDDIEKIGAKSATALDRIAAKVQQLAGMSQDDIDALVQSIKKDQPADSPSALPQS
jgi:hypothetical protein